MNESNGSKNELDEFFQASQNNITELTKNIQKNAENEIRSSAEDSSSDEVEKVPNESENVAMFRGNRLEGNFDSKNVISPEGIYRQRKFPFYQKDSNLSLLQTKLIKHS